MIANMTISEFKYFFIIALFFFASCKNDLANTTGPKPPAMGVINEIVVIADEDVYNGAIGDSLRYYYSSAFPILPTPEPLFDLRHFTVEDLTVEPLRKELRTYLVLANLEDLDSPTTQMVRRDLGEDRFLKAKENGINSSVGRDKWARGQLLFYLFGNTKEEMVKSLISNFSAIAERVNEHDETSLSANIYTARRVNEGLSSSIAEKFGLRIKIPGDYKSVVEEDSFLWLRKNKRDAVLNIVVSKEPYVDASQWKKDNVVRFRDEYGKKYISSDIEDSYMVTNEVDLPIFEYDAIVDSRSIKEYRGIWEMEKDFKGGPFITYAIPIPEIESLVFVDVFVLAPGTRKRDLMQQLDYIIKTAEITESHL